MIVVGLTGGIASGKSTVLRMFGDAGARIIDLDELSRFVVEPGKPAWREIVRHFGDTVLRADGTLDRKSLGDTVFAHPEERKKLEQIVHPRVQREYGKRLKQIRETDKQAIVIADVPLLMEIDIRHRFEKVIVVYVPPESQVARLVQRNGWSRRVALDRLSAQMPIDKKAKLADFVIDNTGSREETSRQVKRVYGTLKMLAQGKKGRSKEKG